MTNYGCMEYIMLAVAFITDLGMALIDAEMSEMKADSTAVWECIDDVCIDAGSKQRVGDWLHLTVKRDGYDDQMWISVDCAKKAAVVTSGRRRIGNLPDNVCD